MKKILTIIFVSISVACLAQAPKEQAKKEITQIDSAIFLSPWHMQQITAFDAEIKRLGGTTIEAEQQRLNAQKQLLINSAIVAKVNDPSRIKDIGQIDGNKIPLVLTPLKPKK